MPIVPKILQFSGNLFSARIRVAKVHERTDHFLHPLVVFNKHVSQFLELGSALRMGVAIGSRQGRVEVPGGMVEINGCNSHTDTDHCQLRIGTTLSRVVTSAL